MFALFDTGVIRGTKPVVEQRVLCFDHADGENVAAPGGLSNMMEVKVFRSNGRKRILPELKPFQGVSSVLREDNQKAPRPTVAGGGIAYVWSLCLKMQPGEKAC